MLFVKHGLWSIFRTEHPSISSGGSLYPHLFQLLFLQTAMLEAFSEDAARGVTRNAWPGFGVIVLALFMILRAGSRLKSQKFWKHPE